MKCLTSLAVLAMWVPTGACLAQNEPTPDRDDPQYTAIHDDDTSGFTSAEPSDDNGQEITNESVAQTAEQPVTPMTPSADAARPGCVNVTHTSGIITQTVYVHNHCSYTVSFVVHRVGPDSPCLHASPHRTRWYRWANGLNYQGTTFGCD
jgi:hypothetical protein